MSVRRRSDACAYNTLLTVFAGLLVLAGCQGAGEPERDGLRQTSATSGPENATYRIAGASVSLVDGMSETPAAPGSASKIRTRVLGQPTMADLNDDGVEDAVLILTQETGGSGTFYYLAAAVATPSGYVGTDGLFLGDRIDPIAIRVSGGTITVTYMTHGPEQSFAEEPAVETIRDATLSADGRTLVQVARVPER